MPREKNKKGGVRDEEDGDSCDSVPDLVLSGSASDIEETDDDITERNVGTFSDKLRKSSSNSESVEMWFQICESNQEKHYHTMKIHLLAPFLFGIVYHEDKWINWAYDCKLLPLKSSFEFIELGDEHFQAVDIIEDAFEKLKDTLFTGKNESMEELLNMMDKVSKAEKLDKAVVLAESFTAFGLIRDNMMRQIRKKKGDVALLLAYNQVYVHVIELTRNLRDLTEEFEKNCRVGEQESSSKKREGNAYFLEGKYRAAISAYTKALHISPFSYILYGNRAQSYLKTQEYKCALADGRRAIVLKTEWPKGQYRYAEALYHLNMKERAIKANYEAMRHCKNDRDLSQQCLRFKKKQEAAGKKMPAKKLSFDKSNGFQESVSKDKLLNGNSDIKDLPDLVEAQSSDTSNGGDDHLRTQADGNSADSSTSDSEINADENHGRVCENCVLGFQLICSCIDQAMKGKTKQQKARKVRRPSEPPELIDMSTEDSDSDDARYTRERQIKSQRDELLKQKRRKEKEEKKRAKLAKEKKEADRKLAEREKILDERKAERDRKRQETMKKVQAAAWKQLAKEEQKTEEKLINSENKKQQYQTAVKEGSRSFLSDEFLRAINHYGEALLIFAMEGTQMLDLKDSDHMLLLYALGTAYLETGLHENIQLALKNFQNIIIKYGDKFPLAYYGLGRVYQKQNRFFEALEPLHHGLELVKTEDTFIRHKWPGSETFIEENKPDWLKTSIQGIIAICKNPPKADAVCRFSECSIGRTHIYFTDFDYKGFVRLICNEACNVEFHPFCWKKFKTVNEEKSGDKDFIDDTCMTPDCSAPVVAIQIYDQEGMKTVFKSEKSKSELKNKVTKQGKVKTFSRPPKKHKKVKLDETRQPDQMSEHSETGGSEIGDEKIVDNSDHTDKTRVTQVENEEKPSQVDVKPHLDNCVGKTEDAEQLPEDPDTGVYILRKPSVEDEGQVQGKAGKIKTKKKKTKNTQSLGEFLKDHGGEQEPLRASFPSALDDLDEIPPPNCDGVPRMPSGWSSFNEPFAVPFHLQEQAETFEEEYSSSHSGQFYSAAAGSTYNKPDIDVMMDYVSSMLREILHANGALEFSDTRIVQSLSILPENYQDIIEKSGGLKKLLNQSTEFVFKGTKIMLSDQLDSDGSTEKINGFSSTLRVEMSNGVDISSHSPPYIPYPSELKFNPDAKEFVPRTSSQPYFEPDVILEDEFSMSEADYAKGFMSLSHQDPRNHFTLNLAPVDLRNFGNSSKTDIVNSELESVDMLNGECNASGNSNFLKHSHSSSSSSLGSSNKKDENKTYSFNSDVDSNSQDKAFNNEGCGNGTEGQGHSNKQTEILGSIKTDNNLDLEKKGSLNGTETGECDKNCKENDLAPPLETSVECIADSKPASNGNLERDLQKQSNGKLVVNVPENVISSKSKGIQTQPLIKSKAVMTESLPDPFKAKLQKVVGERDALQEKLKDAESKQTYHQNRLQQETEKYKKKTTEFQVKIEKFEKEQEQISTKHSTELKALEKENQRLTSQVKTLEEKMLKDDEKYKAQQSNLTKEISALKAQLQSEKENSSKLVEQLSRKDEELKKLTSYGHLQQARAQEAEVKLLELRRDVGLRFLERAFQEAHLTINNLQQAKNARHHSLPPTIKELLTAWQNYVTECHSRIVMCKSSFDEQIQLVKDCRPLNTLPPLSIPGAPQYPGPPLLQQLVPPVPGQKAPQDTQPQQFSVSQKLDNKATVQAANVMEAPKPPVVSQMDTTSVANVSAMPQAQGHLLRPLSGGYMHQSVQQASQGKPSSVAAVATGAGAQGAAAAPPSSSAATAVQEPKAKPSSSFEKIMLRLSTMYPNYTRLELTGFIKEVRNNNKNGSLTGLSLEDIVASVKELVEQKKKQGQLRPITTAPSANPPSRNTSSPRSLQHPPAAPTPNTAVAAVKPMVVQQPAEGGSKVALPKPIAVSSLEEEEDPCVICHEDMNISSETVTLECGHKYHSNCIRKWLMGEQSTCPTCRVHALLPDEFPRLK